MMTKKRKIKSTLYSEPKPQFLRAFIVVALGIVVAVGPWAVSRAQAATINVPADYATIQDAVNAAASGDTIMVAPGDYAGAEILTTVKIIGSGPGTRITTGIPPWGDGLIIFGAPDTKISNLAIDVIDPLYPLSAGVTVDGANNCTVRDLQITAGHGVFIPFSDNVVVTDNDISGTPFAGIYPLWTNNFVASGNTITGPMERGIWPRRSDNATITNNTITGEMWRAIHLWRTSNPVISNNMIDKDLSPPEAPWWNGAIAVDRSTNCTIQGNIIRGEGRSAIHLWDTDDSIIIGNDCSGYTSNWGGDMTPTEEKGLCQMWFGRNSDGNRVSGNIWGPVHSDGVAVVFVSPRHSPSSNLNILENDYRLCDVPGWASADGPGCVLLANGTENSFVFESGNFPPGTGGAQNQVVDLTIELTGSTTNRVVGHPADFLVEDLNPGIGQRLQELIDQLDALPEPEEEEVARP
jgi:parallel beta-helix repeat protein